MQFITNKIDKLAAVENASWLDIQKEAAKHQRSRILVESFSEAQEISDGQRKWWKGILLPALANNTGDSIQTWETRLKIAVLPDEFQPETITVCGETYTFIPSITKLSMKKLNVLIEGSVDHLRDEKIYGDQFLWATLPDSDLKKDKD